MINISACTHVSDNWKIDLQALKENMLQKDVGLNTDIKKSDVFSQQVDKIIKNLSRYKNDDEVIIEISRTLSALNQVHTNLNLGNPDVLPIQLFMENNKLYVSNTLTVYSDILYAEIIEINKQPINKIINQLEGIVSVDNRQGLLVQIPSKILTYTILHGLRIIKNDEPVSVKFQLSNGEKITKKITFKSSLDPKDPNDKPINPNQDKLLYEKYFDKYYDYTYLVPDKALYIAYNRCYVDPEYSMEQFTNDVKNVIQEKKIDRIIVDLRNNWGGDSSVIQPLKDYLSHLSKLNKRIIILTSRFTASSAMLNALEFREDLGSVIIGELVNGEASKPGDVLQFTLPQSKLTVNYSSRYLNLINFKDSSLIPDRLINPTISDLKNGDDPVMKQALEFGFPLLKR